MATRTKPIANRSSKYLEEALYKKVVRNGSSDMSVRTEINDFLRSRKRVYKWEVGDTVRLLRSRKRFSPALKLSEAMSKRGMNPTVSDLAVRLDLVAKARGITSAEEYFINLPEPAKTHLTYGALLNCYCKELMTEKAEALMEKMEELKFAPGPMAYNSLMTLYTKTAHPEKVPTIIQKMKANDIMPDGFTYNVWMRALAALGDISGVERVIEEMKRDGRVMGDWTTYSNLASIYVDAGLFQKAELALKELEKRNGRHDLGAYQFLITLYGRTGNLLEVYRVWRSLKLAFRNMANISYLNLIQVLVNLKDLPGAEACFKEWESQCSTYDIRIANVLIGAYTKEGKIEDAEAIKKRAAGNGAKANAKTWEILMNYHLKEKDMEAVFESVENAVAIGKGNGKIWMPPEDVARSLMAYFEEQKDVESAEKFIKMLRKIDNPLKAEVFETLIRTYVGAEKKFPGMRRRLKMEKVDISEDADKFLAKVDVE